MRREEIRRRLVTLSLEWTLPRDVGNSHDPNSGHNTDHDCNFCEAYSRIREAINLLEPRRVKP